MFAQKIMRIGVLTVNCTLALEITKSKKFVIQGVDKLRKFTFTDLHSSLLYVETLVRSSKGRRTGRLVM